MKADLLKRTPWKIREKERLKRMWIEAVMEESVPIWRGKERNEEEMAKDQNGFLTSYMFMVWCVFDFH